MKEINELIVTIAKKKAEAAREIAGEITLNDVKFKEGIHPEEVEMEKGIKELSALLDCKIQSGYEDFCCSEGFVHRVRWFVFEGVRFFEGCFMRLDDVPTETTIFKSKEDLYASV